jgi:SAM-dependent methyltransferase
MWERRLRKLLRYRTCGALLDVGTGTGQFLHIARSHFNVEGTEVSASAVKIAKERYGLAVTHGTLEEASADSLSGSRFDVITLFHVLEHVPEPVHTLSACKKLLAEDGLLVIAVPNEIYRWNRPIRRILGLLRVGRFASVGAFGLPRLDLSEPGGELHLSHFTCTVLKRLLEQQGFRMRELGLDPFYAALGFRAALHTMIYNLCSIVLRVTGVNIYDTIWVVAEKK